MPRLQGAVLRDDGFADGRGFAITWATREYDWPGDLAKINMVLTSFDVV